MTAPKIPEIKRQPAKPDQPVEKREEGATTTDDPPTQTASGQSSSGFPSFGETCHYAMIG